MKLTDKQCRFADAVSSGINPTAAYRDIYNMSDKRPATATEAASRLMKNSNVVARIEAVSEATEAKIASDVAWDKARIINELSINVDLGRENGGRQLAASNQAINLIGKAINVFEPETIAVTGSVSVIHSLSDAVLDQLASMAAPEPVTIEDTGSIEASYKLLEPEPE